MNFTSVEYAATELHRDVSRMLSFTFEERDNLYKFLLTYIANNMVSGPGQNFYTNVLSKKPTADELTNRSVHGRVVMKIGTGEFTFKGFDGETMYALHHQIGKPVGTDCGVSVMRRLVIFSEGTLETMGSFLNKAVELMETSEEDKFICYTWKIRYQYWDQEAKVNKRPISSVVLPDALKSKMISDIGRFLEPKTRDFYLRNGIPYRRSYLFYGVPGSGKTSMVQALAAHFGRSVCFLMPTHPEMTDDSLRAAVNSIPENSIVVFEDIDALFEKNRSSRIQKSSLTFSGLLNALDGIGSTNGQIFVLTTNLRENLDHALIRNGRVDLHFEFKYAVHEQMELMWRNFYPDAAELATAFADSVSKGLTDNNLQVTTAGLQHFFVTQMESTPEEALANVDNIVEEIKNNSSQSMLEAASTKKDNKGNKKNKKNNKKADKDGKEPKESGTENETASATPTSTVNTSEEAPKTAVTVETDAARGKKNKKNRNKKDKKAAEESPNSAAEVTVDPVGESKSEEKEKKKDKKNNRLKKSNDSGESHAESGIIAVSTEVVALEAESLAPTTPVKDDNADNDTKPLEKRSNKKNRSANKQQIADGDGVGEVKKNEA